MNSLTVPTSLAVLAGNPLLPSSYDIIWTFILGGGLILFVIGLVLVGRLDESPQVKLLLALLVLVLPVIGSLGVIWLYVSKRRTAARS